jgi:hypothetical protein
LETASSIFDAVRYLEIDGPEVISVYIYEQDQPLQFVEAEAGALMAILDTGYVFKIGVGPAVEAFKAMVSPMDP